jgi:hypothetical protein
MIGALRRLMEGATAMQLELVVTFVGFRKAFDSVNRRMMFAILRHYGVPERLVNAIASLYTDSKAAVLVGGKLSRYFDIWSGVLQGDVLAPYLFIIVVDYVMSRSEGDFGFIYKAGTARTKRKLNDLDYADDIALLEMSITKAAEQLLRLSVEASKVGLEVNTEKN